ncbi:MAG TPA: LCP family protein [Amnibacterium sp.]|jgi:LCP family protein required for cell wall assembly
MGRNGVGIRHGAARRDRAPRWVRLLRTVLVVVVVCAVAGVSLTWITAWRLTSQLQHSAVDIGNGATVQAPSIGAFSGAFTVLLVGADNSSGQSGFGASRDATLNDVNILVHVNTDHTSATVVSLPRDLVLDQPQCTDPTTKQVYAAVSAEPLNTAISRGGLGCVVATVEQQTGLAIPYAALFSFQGTVAMADAVGGVQVCATKAIDDPASGLKLPAGVSTITGRTALAYLRDRHGIGDGSDLGRIASQQAYMSSVLRKMTSSSTLMNPAKLYGLASAAAKNVVLSKSLADVDTMVTMMLALKQIALSKIAFVQYPVVADPQNSNKVVPNATVAAALMARVKAGTAIPLSTTNLGSSAVVAKPATGSSPSSSSTPSPSPSASSSSSSALRGLTGQTASEQTCSVAASS